uniref:CCHC-type domain-containing protein n=1 Tax=Fagus sylvatica TaxID=28930 RepID=A0A2N9I6P9_FAGSY
MAGVVQPANFSDIRSDIPELKGDNYKIWKERVLLHLGWMDIDYAIRKDEPPALTDTSTAADITLYERWERSNRLSMMFIKTRISAGIRGSVDQHEKVRDLLKAIDEQFVTSDKALASTLIMKFSSLRLTSVRGVREHIMQMRDTVAQLKKLEVEMSESFLVHYILNTLPHQYGPFKISYNTHKEKWSINELMTMCVQEEGRLVMEQGESAMLATRGKGKSQANQKGKGKIPPQTDIKKDSKCFFCKKKGHMKKECAKFQKWLADKGFAIKIVPDLIRKQDREAIAPLKYKTGVEQPIIEVPQAADDIPVDQVVQELPRTFEQRVEPHTSQEYDGTTLRRSIRPKRSAIPDDYVVYLQESDYNIGAKNDPEFFSQAMSCKESELWYNAMKEEMNSMKSNGVWDLVELPNGVKAIGSTNDKGLLHEVKQFLSKNFDMKDMGEASYVIGIKIHRDRFQASVAPIVKGDRFNLNQCPKNDLEREQMKNIPYASAVGSLMYAQVCTRLTLTLHVAVGMLGRYQSDPGLDHWRAAKKVMSGAVSWRSAKQTLTATSTMEAEFVSCFEATSHGVWLKSFISGLRIMDSISRPLRMYCDNSAAVFMAKNNKSGSRSKHIDIKYLAIRERIKEKKVVIEHVSTKLMIADPLTKGMPPLKFKDHVAKMGLGSII